MPNQEGLEWVQKTFGLEPRWTKEPNMDVISKIARRHLMCNEADPVHVSFHAQGAFNKLYKVSAGKKIYLMRISLPVDPHYKTESEVSTIEFIRQKTHISVPRIFAYDSNNENELGFEWILMELVPGTTLHSRWRKISWEAKKQLVKALATYQAELFEHRFPKIGNIFRQESELSQSTQHGEGSVGKFSLDRMVSLIFFWGDHLSHDVSRGPFTSSHEWLRARLQLVLNDQRRILTTSCDEDEIEDAELAQDVAKKLLDALPTVFLPDAGGTESSSLFHDDLSMANILVDEHGQLNAIIDWECVSALPYWRSCQLPHLLEGPTRSERPEKDNYAPASSSDDEFDNGLDNEGINSLYWIHLLEFEKTQLRTFFIEEMEMAQPEWVTIFKQSSLKADFEKAVQNCDGFGSKIIGRWIDSLATGEIQSLSALFYA